jgi:hypothetical protein
MINKFFIYLAKGFIALSLIYPVSILSHGLSNRTIAGEGIYTRFSRSIDSSFNLTITSGTNMYYLSDDGWLPSVATWVYPGWPSLPDATWVWKSYLVDPYEAIYGSDIITFKSTFFLPPDANDIIGTINITADNAYELSLNGVVIGSDGILDPSGSDQSWMTVETYNLLPQPGMNELSIRMINYHYPNGTPYLNPAGLLFRAEIAYSTNCPSDKWNEEYYDNTELQGTPVIARCGVENIDFYWGEGSPDISLPADNYSARWYRLVGFPVTGWYRFRTFTDDGLRLFIDGKKIIDDWSTRSFDERSAVINIEQGSHQIVMEYFEGSEVAMAYLNWYLCQDGLISCNLDDIKPFYQTNYLDQPMPTACNIENHTIATWGCGITSIAMALEKYGIYDGPDDLNDWLSVEDPNTHKPRGYVSTCDANVLWAEVEEYAYEKGIPLKFNSSESLGIHDINDTIEWIENHNIPVIMKITGGIGNHYVLAMDGISTVGQNTLGINDPYHSYQCWTEAADDDPSIPPISLLKCTTEVGIPLKHADTLLKLNNDRGGGITLPFAVYTPRNYQNPRTPSLQFAINGAEVLVTDLHGRRVGYDETTGEFISEIPNAIYYNSEIVPPGGEPSGEIQRGLYIAENAGGIYTISLYGQTGKTLNKDGLYTIDIFGFDENFRRSELYLTGPIEGSNPITMMYKPDSDQIIIFTNKSFIPLIIR